LPEAKLSGIEAQFNERLHANREKKGKALIGFEEE